ncbi:MAG: glycosyltransferase family 2 protein [Candidatus Blackburnbacteria bacterium]|nr:glycosyltransferase family 2 protein [Candidatus Blackburnbacteria bacterium]
MISAVVLTNNEERNITECLKCLKWCDEIVVIDDYSEDKTTQIASKFGAKIYQRHLENDFGQQRNFGLQKAKGEWVLFVDADERISAELAAEIQKAITNHAYSGFSFRRADVLWGRRMFHGEPGSVRLLRLAKKGAGKWSRRVHEVWDIDGATELLRSPLLHYPHQTFAEFLTDIDYYSTLHAQANFEEGKRSSILKFIIFPKLKFLQNYIFKMGFLDGVQGFIVAMMMSFHSYLAWGKLWLLQWGADLPTPRDS